MKFVIVSLMMKDPLKFFHKVHFSAGELARVRQFCRPSGHTMILPYDQFIEHDCRHLDGEADTGNPDYIIKLGLDAGYNAVAIHYGLAKRFWTKVEGAIPLILKINGKTAWPSQKLAFAALTSRVEDGVRLGASAIGYTMYYGSPRQDEDFLQLSETRKRCDKYGMPLIVWAYPRGEAVDAKGGKDSSYATESAVRMATEMGATIIKANLPKPAKPDFFTNEAIPEYYRKVEKELLRLPADKQKLERAKRVVQASQGVPMLFSGGEEISENDFKENAATCLKAGCFGFIFGRNIWKRKHESAMKISKELMKLLDK